MNHNQQLTNDFPAMHLVRTGRLVRLFGRVTFIALLFSIIGMLFVPWRQTAPGYGEVVALDPQQRAQSVVSQIKGVISYVKPGIREGIAVEEGDVLLRLEPLASEAVNNINTQILTQQLKREASKASINQYEEAAKSQESAGQKEVESLSQDLKAANEKWEQSKKEIVVQKADLSDKQNKLRIAEEIATQGLISKEDLFSARQVYEAQYNKVLQAESKEQETYASLQSLENEIESKKQVIDVKNRTARSKVLDEMGKLQSIEKELIDLKAKLNEYDRLDVKAPRSGVIQKWSGLEGSDTVKEGDELFVIVPNATDMAVELKINGNDMPLVKEGDHVRLQFEGWPAIQFVGWPSVAVGTFGGKVNRIFPTDDGKGSFSLVVTPEASFDGETEWPDNRYLRQGVRANGWVLLRQVSLGYEIWRQLNGFPPVISSEEPKEKKESKIKLPKP